MAVGAETEVLHCLPSILRSAEKESVCSSRGTQSELVQSQDLTTSLLNPGPSSSRETKCCNRQLRDSQKTVVVSDGADHNDSLALVGVGHIGYNARERNGGAIDPGHEKAAQDDLVEVGFRTTGEESVELHQDLQVDVLALGRLAMGAAHMVAVQVDTHGCCY